VFKTEEKQFEGREEAMDWIDTNQLGRRNLTPDQAHVIRGRLYNRAKKTHGGQIPASTAEVLAIKYGVSPATIKRDGKIAEVLAKNLEEGKAVLRGEKKLADVRREQKRSHSKIG